MSRTKPAPSWSEAVSAVLGDRDPHREQAFDTDATVVIAALKALVATGRCVATGPNAAFQPIRTLRVAAQDEAGAALRPSTKRTERDFAHWAIALEGERGSWIANVTAMTYLPSRRGAPAERVVFHLALGRVLGHPFIHDAHLADPQLQFASGWLLLTEADLDVPWLLSGVDPTDLDSLGEAVMGKPRASFVPVEERRRKEEAIAAVRAAYLAHRGDMPRALRQDDVDVIVRTGLDYGLLINLDLVHSATGGRGSPNAVYPKLADAMQRLAPRRASTTDVDPALLALWQQLGQAATAAAEEALVPARHAPEEERAAVAAERAQLQAERAQDERATAERQRHLAHMTQALEEAHARIDSLANVERGQLVEIEGLKHDRTSLQQQLTVASDELTALRITHARVVEERDRARTELTQRERAHATERERAADEQAALAADLAREATAARERLAEVTGLQQELTTTHAALQDSLVAQRAAEATCVDQADQLARLTADKLAAEKAATAANRELATWRQRHDEVAEARIHASGELANLRAEHQAVTRERDRLDRLLARLSPTKHPKAR